MLITLDNGEDHTRPNTLGPRGLGELNAALDAALARDDIAAIVITGKPFILAAGADLSAMGQITEREQALAIARIGHAVFDKLHTLAGADLRASSTGWPSAAGWRSTLHATTARCRPPRPGSRCPSASWACSPAGAGPTWCPT